MLNVTFDMTKAACLPNGAEIFDRAFIHGRWFVLCRWAKNSIEDEWVTWECDGDGNAFWGRYFSVREFAMDDFQERTGHCIR
jgi:hypothetical protein